MLLLSPGSNVAMGLALLVAGDEPANADDLRLSACKHGEVVGTCEAHCGLVLWWKRFRLSPVGFGQRTEQLLFFQSRCVPRVAELQPGRAEPWGTTVPYVGVKPMRRPRRQFGYGLSFAVAGRVVCCKARWF